MVVGLTSSEILHNRTSSPSLKAFHYHLEAVRDIVDEVQVPDKHLGQNSEVLQSECT